MRKYRLVAKKGEGTFSEVLKAQNIKDGKYHAIKCMKNRFENIDQVNNLREIQALRRLSPHEHVVTLEEVLYDQPTGRLALVFELMDGNLYEIIRGRRHYLNPQLIKGYMWQLMKSLDHMHKKGIFHRDIKPENILVDSHSEFGHGLKLADFGSCRGIYSKQPYTEYISTRWYRAPECLLTDGYYGPEMDLWGAGCVMFEITTLFPLFPGANEADQIARIHKIMGTHSEALEKLKSKGASHISFDFTKEKGTGITEHLKHASPEAVDLMHRLLKYDAADRITARDAMKHPYFRDIRELEIKKQQLAAQQAAAQQQQQQQHLSSNSVISGAPNISNDNKQQQKQQNTQKYKQNSKQNYHHNNENQYSLLQQQMLQQQQQQQKSITLAPITNSNNNTHGHNNSKGLPNIMYSSNDHNNNGNQYHQQQYQQQAKNFQQANNKHYTTVPQNHNNSNNHMSSLPPILGGNINNFNNSQLTKEVNKLLGKNNQNHNNHHHNHHHSHHNNNGVQKKRKKYRLNYSQEPKGSHHSNVLKAYGINK